MFEIYREIIENKFYQELMHLISILLAVPLALLIVLLLGARVVWEQLVIVIRSFSEGQKSKKK
jgi:hypothetical protein